MWLHMSKIQYFGTGFRVMTYKKKDKRNRRKISKTTLIIQPFKEDDLIQFNGRQ